MEWSIQELSRRAGVSSRTLRHWHDQGLLVPSRIGTGGMRWYDESLMPRLQRILLMRELGIGLADIADSLTTEGDGPALRRHQVWLRAERDRIDRQIAAVEHTLSTQQERGIMSAEASLDGFDQSQYKDEVIERWGEEAWQQSQDGWNALSAEERQDFMDRHTQIADAYLAARTAGMPAESDEVQAIARAHWRWIGVSWGTREPNLEMFANLGDMYVEDLRFAKNYEGPDDDDPREGARFVRDAMVHFALVPMLVERQGATASEPIADPLPGSDT